MSEEIKKCLVCEQSSNTVPLLKILYAEKEYYICPAHLPILIHHPDQLSNQLPGAANLIPHEH